MVQNLIRPITRLLIANRGEIACRIIRTAKRLGIHTIAIYAIEDQTASHTLLADEAFCIGSAAIDKCYLNINNIIDAAKQSHADAIHPGYGFLSENAAFAERCQNEKMIFIGPGSDAIAKMAVKDEAKKIMRQAGVPVVPGYEGTSQSVEDLQVAASQIGYPLILKAAKGGGGKGMRIVKDVQSLKDAIESAKRESLASFGDDTLFIEKYLTAARHIEIQIFRDSKGNAVHLFERDCSLQRRHQKVIEESPAINISEDIKQKLYTAAINAAHAINYVGAGTIEFLYAKNGEFYFMEMNTRLQVEHPVTEMVTGLDLVEWQIRIAEGYPLPLTQEKISCQGHAMEARIYAEDPSHGFLPVTGKIKDIFLPEGIAYRLDSGIQIGDKIGIHFDPMLAKLIVHAPTRTQAISALYQALSSYHLVGITTNIDFLRNILLSNEFTQGQVHTQTLEQSLNVFIPKAIVPDIAELAIAAFIVIFKRRQAMAVMENADPYSPWHLTQAWRLNIDCIESMTLYYLDNRYTVSILHLPMSETGISLLVTTDNHQTIKISGHLQNNRLNITLPNHQTTIPYYCDEESALFIFQEQAYPFLLVNKKQDTAVEDKQHLAIRSPMPGIITKIWAKAGDKVTNGTKLLAVEAMKMEHTLASSTEAVIKAVRYNIGDQVEEGCELIDFE
jgi:3-methylcrotonyl-CoA carboxylase alpha subunit